MPNGALFRPGLAIDPVHDGRHTLRDHALARESVPYLVHLPEEGIALFTYTWVDRASSAGALLAIFGPGVGPEPIQLRLADRLVSKEMGFDAWKIAGFTMRHDMKFGAAQLRWESPEATLDLAFEAYHPPYAYSAHAQGCLVYAADDRIEQSGRVRGTLVLRGRTIRIDTSGHRDHSWGTRDWLAIQHYKWFQGQVGDEISVHFWQLHALGKTELRGYVFKDGLLAEATGVELSCDYGPLLTHNRFEARVRDEAGRTTSVSGEVYARYRLIPHPEMALNEGAARSLIDGRPALGWMEQGWPKAYLDHIAREGY
jgi:hypothetical protein